MKKIVSLMAMIAISLAANAVRPYSLTNIWAEVEAYPTGAGKVYITSNDAKPLSESGWGETSESHFTIGKSGETTHYNAVNGTFEPYYIPRFYGIIQVAPEAGYDCVGLVKRIDESGSYSDEDYYYGGPATYNKIADLHAYDRPMNATYEIFIQNDYISGPKAYKAYKSIKAGSYVTSEKENGSVTFHGGKITLEAPDVELQGETTIDVGTEFEIKTK